tara:strand:- start:1389 stop:2567 length:1179 start_codon:yes stop_codon:yes gene_type:complete
MAENQENDVQEEVVEATNVEQDLVDQQEVEPKVEAEVTAPKNEVLEDGTVKLDLTSVEEKAPTSATNEFKTPETVAEVPQEQPVEEQPVLEEITEEEVVEQTQELQEDIVDAIQEQKESGVELPENIQKVVDFISDTGGSLEDYVKLNQDYSKYEDDTLLREFYAQTKPHLNRDEIDFLMEDNFKYDEESDEERDIKRKKLALKEQVANAKSHLDGQKSKYYEEIKAGSRLAPEQKKAIDFFDRYEKEAKDNEKHQSIFLKKTENVFTENFKGFDYKVGEKKYRFNVKDAEKIKNTQSDINNFTKKFLNEKNEMSDATGYHKSLFTAMNPDLVANHFYEQGKADAIKDSVARSKNIDMAPRGTHEKVANASGFQVKAISGESSNDFKIKLRK